LLMLVLLKLLYLFTLMLTLLPPQPHQQPAHACPNNQKTC